MNDFDIGKHFFSIGEYKQALDIFNAVPETSDDYRDSLYLKAFCLGKMHNFKTSLKILKRLLNYKYKGYNNNFSFFIYNIGVMSLKSGSIKKAYLYFKYAQACSNNIEFIPRTLQVEKFILYTHKNVK